MPGSRSNPRPVDEQDPLVGILAEMLESALNWESEHESEVPSVQNQLTEPSTNIHLNSTDLLPTDAAPESPPKGDKHVPARIRLTHPKNYQLPRPQRT